MEDLQSNRIRLAAFEWLQNIAPVNEYVLHWKDLQQGFQFKGQNIILIGAKGIWKPKQNKHFPISITSVQKSVYQDRILDDTTMHYSYRGENPMHLDNVALRGAMENKIPLIYFHQIEKGKYFVAWPVFIIGDEPDKLRFLVRVENEMVLSKPDNFVAEPEAVYRQKYATREVLVRLHQQSFREAVLKAYRENCAICSLKHRELLDAAHIIADKDGGEPNVNNGLSLCKIHHAAFDRNIIGINPDYRIEVRNDILQEVDGPMLKYGLQETNGQKIILPRSIKQQPKKEWLEIRYQEFRQFG